MIRPILLISALLLLTGCERKNAGPPSRPGVAVVRPELKVNLKEKVGETVEVTGLLVAVSIDGTKEQDKWVGETTATLECKGMTLACKFPRATKTPVPARSRCQRHATADGSRDRGVGRAGRHGDLGGLRGS